MNILVDCPKSSVAEWRFSLLGSEVRVKFWFWLAVVLTCNAQDTGAVIVWVAVCLASVLLHEFGHALAFRHYREGADIVLYGWGGITLPFHHVRGTTRELVTSLAGVAAGLAAAAAAGAVARLSGGSIITGWRLFYPVVGVRPPLEVGNPLWWVLLNYLVQVNFYWSLLNLLPVYPLDGWHAARVSLSRRKALMLSAGFAGALALGALLQRSIVFALAFLVLAVSSAQALEDERPEPGPYRPWRG